jgi:dihydroorotate dehydrogenase electron transfer subunit
MQIEYRKAKVLENKEMTPGVFSMKVERAEKEIRAGQFYMLRSWNNGPILSRPISVCEFDENSITFAYLVVGKGTEMFSELEAGEKIEVMGPLGNGFQVDSLEGKVAIVAGGIGNAPMIQVSKELKKLNKTKVDFYAGFRNDVYLVDDVKDKLENLNIATESGSRGHKGYVTDNFDPSKYDVVLCCGPEIMMNKVVMMCREAKTPIYVSMEKHMACGVGACLVCTCKTKDGNKRSCKDGPVFFGDDIVIE